MLWIIRGCPGAGKTTLAKSMSDSMGIGFWEADKYFELLGFKFNYKLLKEAHLWCFLGVKQELQTKGSTIVSNTSTTEAEVNKYIELAKDLKIPFTVVTVENWENRESVHSVPKETVEKMRERYVVKL